MGRVSAQLVYAVRGRFLAHYLGQFFLVIAVLGLATPLVALLDGELPLAAAYAAVAAGFAVAGLLLKRVQVAGPIQVNEAMVLAALVFLVTPPAMALPLWWYGAPYADALFETVSAVTTTGLSTLGDPSGRPETFLFARAWMQWYGGLGIVVLSLALLVRPGPSAMRLGMLDAADADLVGGTRTYARLVIRIYALLTLAGWGGWLLCGGTPREGLLFVLAAVSTGGFAPQAASLAALSVGQLAWWVTLVCVAGAVPLALYHVAWRKGVGRLAGDLEFRTLLLAGLGVALLLGVSLWARGMDLAEALFHAPLMAFSAQTTAGFSTLDPGTLDPASKGLLILSMATGGSVGSTAGGFKLLRLLVLAGLAWRTLRALSMPPDAVLTPRLAGRRLEPAEVQDALMIILLYLGGIVLSWLVFLGYGAPPLDALFEVVSATGTVGLSAGLCAESLPLPLKLVLCADMLLGRLEFVAWLALLYPRTWFGRHREAV